ncbi:TonB-dependent receptor plug domain-containing protein [Pseudobacteriovorax antillogorgiicola]|uniref:Iron complex outermembrane recepter protein n=1 Tax=Pseudobacteriovorax antillogorgiicola TaxID=1513793 RepID=A0A1Y6CK79_9BACT|nr:TonB-dependent receptor [Pseudobacteriovorax antillogorgiicola]TCS47591.1 iron complex outermembrane receptor protein [Pseudobacteriovorax antillogorgiicola]SMF60226.1 iron complex outermembrane recepter protein [Pseudobacteriovorax antillogorgiicola]
MRAILSGLIFLLPLRSVADSNSLDMSLSDILSLEVETASSNKESIMDAPASIIVITEDDIINRGYENLMEVLSDLPGFDVIGTSAWDIAYQRGYRTPFLQRTLVMIDGQNINNLWTHNPDINHVLPLESFSRIEVLYGPTSAVYGPNAFLGIINFITKKSQDLESGQLENYAKISFGTKETKILDARSSGNLGSFSFSVDAKYHQSKGFDWTWDEKSYTGFYDNRDVWGPIVDHKSNSFTGNIGDNINPKENKFVSVSLETGKFSLAVEYRDRQQAYGPFYSSVKAQSNTPWGGGSTRIFSDYSFAGSSFNSKTFLQYRESSTYGDWAEGYYHPSQEGDEDAYKGITLTHWRSDSWAALLNQDFEFELSSSLRILAGLKVERKNLQKAYIIPGYWCTNDADGNPIPTANNGTKTVLGVNCGDSVQSAEDSEVVSMPIPDPWTHSGSGNRVYTTDAGIYALALYKPSENWTYNSGIRYDENTSYGASINPRFSVIYKPKKTMAFKLILGTAFQEPAPLQVYGGWNGRAGNEDLKPEKVRNAEVVFTHVFGKLYHEVGSFFSSYEDVVKEEAENAGEREVYGLEYKMNYSFLSPLSSRDAEVDFNYTYTISKSSITYDHGVFVKGDNASTEEGQGWIDNGSMEDLGDIAPHKANLIVNLPTAEQFNMNYALNYVSSRDLYLRNPLRRDNEALDGYLNIDTAFAYRPNKEVSLTLKVQNILDNEYFHPGGEQADSGINRNQPAAGFRNSLIPQPKRTFLAGLKAKF